MVLVRGLHQVVAGLPVLVVVYDWVIPGSFLYSCFLESKKIVIKAATNTNNPAPPIQPPPDEGPLIDNTRREVQTSAPARVQPKNDSTTSDFPGLMPSPDITGNNPPSDSVQQATAIQLPPFLPADTVVKKRPRGVQGITDNDYRIVPKKDSTNN